ncbi:hypothetical protein CLV29_1836 [Naumannella halotolerans]|uniref:Uncharacterized protein n=1 Tax=Naumannella halotolerans TaxID=993414 RepID=A0A4R7J9I1_9ACTN|nr:hypothetical protein CLV29_1836 [Naumannella halotolerans]
MTIKTVFVKVALATALLVGVAGNAAAVAPSTTGDTSVQSVRVANGFGW